MKIDEKKLKWLFLLLVVISFGVNYYRLFDIKLDTNGDNYHYLLLAHSLATGEGYYSTVGPEPVPHTHFPPGYPAFMSVFLRLFPNNILVLKLLNGLLLLVSLLLLFRIIRKTTGRYGLWYALAACLLCTFHVLLLRWATILMSEMLYTAISMGIITLCLDLDLEQVWKKNGWHILRLVGLCLLVASAFFVRTMGISVILAAALAFFVLAAKALIRRKKEAQIAWWKPALTGVLVLVSLFVAMESWNLRNQRVAPGTKNDYMTSFSIPSAEELPNGKMAFWTDRIYRNLRSFVPYYIPHAVLDPGKAQMPKQNILVKDYSWTRGLIVVALLLIGLLSFKGLEWLLVSYFVITFGVLCIYPPQFSDTRYFVPLIPLMLAAFVVGVGTVMSWLYRIIRHRETRWLPVAVIMAMTIILLPLYFSGQKTFRNLAASKNFKDVPGMIIFQHYIDACMASKNFSPKQLAAVLKPEIYYLYSNYHHAIPLPRTGTPEEVIKFLEDNNVEVLILDTWFASSYRVIVPTLQAYPDRFAWLWEEGDPKTPTAILGFLVSPDGQPEPAPASAEE